MSATPSTTNGTPTTTTNGHTPDYTHYPHDVGIIAADIYFPQYYITQSDLEHHMNVSPGKYTIGLGQHTMSFVTDREDIYSIVLSAVAAFMQKYNVDYRRIGRIEVGTETISDHSKAVKTVIMSYIQQLAAQDTRPSDGSTYTDIEGIDCMNACYGGTNALFNCVDWVESSAWDGRYALCIAADIAEYANGTARPTGGVGAVCMLVGENAVLAVERGTRSTHMEHAYDFFKPHMDSPHPVVDGKFSGICYLRALDICYARYCQKVARAYKRSYSFVDDTDYVTFHAPYNKLVQKSYARLMHADACAHPQKPEYAQLQQYVGMDKEQSYVDVPLEKAFVAASKQLYQQQVTPTTLLPQQVGNMYTASMYAGLVSLVHTVGAGLAGKKVLMFSYGSGLAASMFTLYVNNTDSVKQQLTRMQQLNNIDARLQQRTKQPCSVLYEWMDKRESMHHTRQTWELKGETQLGTDFVDGAFYLNSRDESGRRTYKRVQKAGHGVTQIPLPH